MVNIDSLFIERMLGFILALILVYYAFALFKTLENKEIAISMVFLHKKQAINLFGLLVVAAVFIFLTGFYFIIASGGLIDDVLLDLDAFTLLLFTYLMNRLMKGE